MITKPIFTLMKKYGMTRTEARTGWSILHKKRLYETDKMALSKLGIPIFKTKRYMLLKQIDGDYERLKYSYITSTGRRLGKWFFRLRNKIKKLC